MTNWITKAAVTVAAIVPLLLAPNAGLAQCCGDCNGDGQVTVDELVTAVNRALTGCSDDGICAQSGGHRFPATGQRTSYGPGSDGDVQASAALSYTDNGDGTITDNNTGLMWEKKDYSGGTHDTDRSYTWGMTEAPYTMNGTMVTEFLAQLNHRCAGDGTTDCTASGDAACVGIGNGKCGFAGHHDWRIPNVKELQSLVDYEVPHRPTVNAAFQNAAGCTVCVGVNAPGCTRCVDVTRSSCSCTASGSYWSSTTTRDGPDYAWYVTFYNGGVYSDGKNDSNYVRAVRGGSGDQMLTLQFLRFEAPQTAQVDAIGPTNAEVDIVQDICPDATAEPFAETLATAVFKNNGASDILLDTIKIDTGAAGAVPVMRSVSANLIGGSQSSLTFVLFDLQKVLLVPGTFNVPVTFSGVDASATRFTVTTNLNATFANFQHCGQ